MASHPGGLEGINVVRAITYEMWWGSFDEMNPTRLYMWQALLFLYNDNEHSPRQATSSHYKF